MAAIRKIIWSLWFQGIEDAPLVVRKCLESWRKKNPGWELRVLDARTIPHFIPIKDHVDLQRQNITAASLSDIVRIMLLHEYGGVWVDATTFCNRPLDDWLPSVAETGFFAFDRPAIDRPLASWFIAATREHPLISHWLQYVLEYWVNRNSADNYFWFHRCFQNLCDEEPNMRDLWNKTTRISADGPHSVQWAGMNEVAAQVSNKVDWSAPVFKLTFRLSQETPPSGSLLAKVLDDIELMDLPKTMEAGGEAGNKFASLMVATENVGDHIQILASHKILERFGIAPARFIDRDHGLSEYSGENVKGRTPIILNGWFKHGNDDWPPNDELLPLIIGFHIRLFQAPRLLSTESLEFYNKNGPVGCRDPHTHELLQSVGVESYISNCLSLVLPYRMPKRGGREKVLVVSRDTRILNYMPPQLGNCEFISHYSGSFEFESNMESARKLLEYYKENASLIVTTLLHCALPAIAMGIPVVVFYPINSEAGSLSDRERFSGLAQLTTIYSLEDIEKVDWRPNTVDVAGLKLATLDKVASYLSSVGQNLGQPIGPIAPSSLLPPA